MTKKRKCTPWFIVKRSHSDQGMTLVEVLLAITILGILAVLMSGFFVNAIGTISRAGDLDRTGYTASKVTENALAKQTLTPEGTNIKIDAEVVKGTAVTTTPDKTIIINFPLTAIEITGDQKMITSTGSRNGVTIEVFIPK